MALSNLDIFNSFGSTHWSKSRKRGAKSLFLEEQDVHLTQRDIDSVER